MKSKSFGQLMSEGGGYDAAKKAVKPRCATS